MYMNLYGFWLIAIEKGLGNGYRTSMGILNVTSEGTTKG